MEDITCGASLLGDCTETLNKDCMWLHEFPLIFPKMADRQRVTGLSPLAALQW